MEVTTIMWSDIHRKDWCKVLEAVPIGNYIRDLPYPTINKAPCLKIPISNDATYIAMDDIDIPIAIRYMEFCQVRLTNPSGRKETVWRRVH